MRYCFNIAIINAIVISAVTCLGGCSCITTHKAASRSAQEAQYLTLETLQSSLPANHIAAGFDIDDTVLFSSPGFYYGMNNTDGPNGANQYGGTALKNPQFWKDLNQNYDKFSLPKKAGKDLLSLHSKRGDSIFFITARYCYDNDAEVLQRRLNTIFSLPASKVVCTNETSKTKPIEENGIEVYYGDADSDIKYSKEVKAKQVRPIRVLRSKMSTNTGGYNPGTFGEEVLADSEN